LHHFRDFGEMFFNSLVRRETVKP